MSPWLRVVLLTGGGAWPTLEAGEAVGGKPVEAEDLGWHRHRDKKLARRSCW
jgi:hypothetical protein